MLPRRDLVPLPGSERVPVSGARAVRPTDPNQRVEVTVRVRPNPASAPPPSSDAIGAQMPRDRQYLSRAAFAAAYGADPADMARVEAFARANGLDIVETDPARRSV